MPRRRVDQQGANRQRTGPRGAAASQKGVDPGQELGKRKRLGQIVVRAGVESMDTVADSVAGRQDEDRRVDPLLTQRRDDIETVETRQPEVEKNQSKRLLGSPPQSRFARFFGHDVVALTLESVAQSVRDLLFVFLRRADELGRSGPRANQLSRCLQPCALS